MNEKEETKLEKKYIQNSITFNCVLTSLPIDVGAGCFALTCRGVNNEAFPPLIIRLPKEKITITKGDYVSGVGTLKKFGKDWGVDTVFVIKGDINSITKKE